MFDADSLLALPEQAAAGATTFSKAFTLAGVTYIGTWETIGKEVKIRNLPPPNLSLRCHRSWAHRRG
jgi:hypothetical protein